MVSKDWHEAYYVMMKGVLFIYKSKMDFQYNPSGTNYKKRIPIAHNMRVLPIKAKEYKG
jgi:hypothetical protein